MSNVAVNLVLLGLAALAIGLVCILGLLWGCCHV